MADEDTPLSRLSKTGLELPPYEPEETPMFEPFSRFGNRIYVSGVPPFEIPDAPIPRLNMDANVEAGVELESLPEDHPLRRAMLGARMCTLRLLAYAQAAADGDLNKVAGCVKARLTVKTGPNFERLGMVYLPVNRLMRHVFGAGPAFEVIGVAALPAGAPMNLSGEFVMRSDD